MHAQEARPVPVFYDTEFTDFADPRPLSIGLVSACGREIYLEREDAKSIPCMDFVTEEIHPLLGKTPGAAVKRPALAYRLSAFLAGFNAPVLLVADTGVDWLMLHELLWSEGRTLLPANANNRRDVIWPEPEQYYEDPREQAAMKAFHAAADACYAAGLPRHHALGDARALRAGVMAALKTGEGSRFIAPWAQPWMAEERG